MRGTWRFELAIEMLDARDISGRRRIRVNGSGDIAQAFLWQPSDHQAAVERIHYRSAGTHHMRRHLLAVRRRLRHGGHRGRQQNHGNHRRHRAETAVATCHWSRTWWLRLYVVLWRLTTLLHQAIFVDVVLSCTKFHSSRIQCCLCKSQVTGMWVDSHVLKSNTIYSSTIYISEVDALAD